MIPRSLIVCTGPPEYPLNHQNWRLAKVLVERGCRVTVVTDLRRDDLAGNSESGWVTTWPSYHPKGTRDFAFLWNLLRRQPPDAILANFGAIYIAMLAGALRRVPIRVAWYRSLATQRRLDSAPGPSITPWIADPAKWAAFGLATHVVPVSAEARDEVCRRYLVRGAKCRVIPTRRPDPAEEFGISHVPSGIGGHIVCVARLVPSKGQDVLLRAFARIVGREPGGPWTLELVGDGPERPALEALATELGVRDRVEFAGQVAHRDVFERAARADVMVVPFLTDAGPGVIAEALGLGLPLVVSRTGAMSELVGGGGAANLVPPGDDEALALTLLEILGSERKRVAMSREARALYLEKFHIDGWIQDVLNLIDDATSKAGVATLPLTPAKEGRS